MGRSYFHPPWHYAHHLVVAAPTGPNWAERWTAYGTLLIAAGAIVALFGLREARRSRHTEAAARMSSRWEAEEYVQAREQIDSYADNMALRDALLRSMNYRTRERHPLLRELSFLEELGAMEKLGGTSLRWIDETMKDLVLARWKLWEPTIVELNRDVEPEHRSYKNFKLLADQLNGVGLNRRQRFARWCCRWLGKQLTY